MSEIIKSTVKAIRGTKRDYSFVTGLIKKYGEEAVTEALFIFPSIIRDKDLSAREYKSAFVYAIRLSNDGIDNDVNDIMKEI